MTESCHASEPRVFKPQKSYDLVFLLDHSFLLLTLGKISRRDTIISRRW